jgi:phage-related protein
MSRAEETKERQFSETIRTERRFCCAVVGRRIVILHQFIKKSGKTPRNELVIARRRMKEVKDAPIQTDPRKTLGILCRSWGLLSDLLCHRNRPMMVLLHAYKKKSQKAPVQEIETGIRRMREVLHEF